MSNEQDEINDIVAELKHLQTQESELLQRLERLSEAESHTATSPTPTREFRIGDLVQIKNPKPFQIKTSDITRTGIDTDRVTAQAKNGSSKIVRSSFDLIHVDQLSE